MMTTDLLSDKNSWGAPAHEIGLNWALAHGYRFIRVNEHFVYNRTASIPTQILAAGESKAARLWRKPRAMLDVLERFGERECPWLLYLDADSVINNISLDVGTELIGRFLGPHVHALLTCHSPFGSGGDCLPCRCCRAGRCPVDELGRLPASDGSWINTGAIFVRNTAEAREMLSWWQAGGRGVCDLSVPPHDAKHRPRRLASLAARPRPSAGHETTDARHGERERPPLPRVGEPSRLHVLGEQMCAQLMQRRWPARVDVLNAAIFNAPVWYDPARYTWFDAARHTHTQVVRDVVQRQASQGRRLADCLGSKLWICHAYDSPPGFRTVAFRERLDAARHKLTAMLSLRSEAYRPFPFDHPKTPE